MKTSFVKYKGELKTEITHLKSSSSYITDAPIDNNGKGSDFSPTDLAATSLASCMITVIGIHCDQNNISFDSASADVKKNMGNSPRRIIQIEIDIDLSGNNFSDKEQVTIERVAKSCPVAKSLHPEIKQILKIKF